MSLRIAFVTIGYAPHRTSGLDISGERLVQALAGEGHQVSVVTGAGAPLHDNDRASDGIRIHRLGLGRSNWIGFSGRAARAVRALNREQPFDVVHFWDAYFACAYHGPFVASLQHSFRQRWSTWDQQRTGRLASVYRWAYYASARTLAEQPALMRAKGLLAASLTARDEYIQHYGVKPEHIAIARHGIDIQRFKPQTETDELRSRYGLEPGEPVILFAGFVTPRKGLEYLAQALPLIRPRPRLLVAGRWSQSYRSRFIRLLGSAADNLIEAGFVADELLPGLYSLADVYVSPSLLEGFGLPLAEALACETPVVAADAGAVAEVVGPGGILVPPRDGKALAQAVSELLLDRKLASELGQRGREHVVANFSVEQMERDTVAAYRRFFPAGGSIKDQSQTPTPGLDDRQAGNENW